MEVFVLGYERKTKKPFAFFILTSLFFDNKQEIKKLRSKYKTFEAYESNYRAAGRDQVCFHFSDLNEIQDILETEPKIVASIKELNLRLMRKGGTIYSPYHCFDLVKDVLETNDEQLQATSVLRNRGWRKELQQLFAI